MLLLAVVCSSSVGTVIRMLQYVEAVSDGNYSQTSSIVLSQRPSRNEGNVVASLPNISEKPVPVEPQSAPVIIQETDTIPVNIPELDTNSHMVLGHLFQQPLENNSSGEILRPFPHGLLKIETEMIANFNMEWFGGYYQHQSYPPDDPPPLSPSVPVIIPVEESHGHSGRRRLTSSHQAATVDNEEQFVMSPKI